jgi:hypothetical protein
VILILVMSARREPWGALMDAQIETWDSEENERTRTLFYCGISNQQSCDSVFYSPRWTESLEDISGRTMEAFEKSLLLPVEWEYLARPNSSCYVHKRNLVRFCDSLPKKDALYGILTEGHPGQRFLWGGCQYIMSRDVVEKLVAGREKWNMNVMEDQAITFLAEQLDIPIESKGRCASINMMNDGSYLCLTYNHGENFYFWDFEEVNKAAGHFFFRCKQDGRRHEDVRIMRELHRCFK